MKKENLDKKELVNLLFNIAIESIKDHKFKENLSHEDFKEEVDKFNKTLKENLLEKSIPYVKKEDRKQILEEYKKIVIDFVTLLIK